MHKVLAKSQAHFSVKTMDISCWGWCSWPETMTMTSAGCITVNQSTVAITRLLVSKPIPNLELYENHIFFAKG